MDVEKNLEESKAPDIIHNARGVQDEQEQRQDPQIERKSIQDKLAPISVPPKKELLRPQ